LRKALQTDSEYINPPTVYPIGGGRYRVKHGSTRVMAAKGVLDSIRVRVVEPPANESGKLLSQMSENLLQGSLRPIDVARALKRLQTADGHDRSLSQLVGALKSVGVERNRSWAAMHLALLDLAPGVQELVNRGEISADAAYRLRSLPHDQQLQWARRIVSEGVSRDELRRQLAPSDEASAELLDREMEERLAEAAERFGEPGATQRRPVDTERRNSPVMSRRELLPVALEATDGRKTRALSSAEWAQKATELERQLAQEALFLGGYSANQAIKLVDRAVKEANEASASVMSALNAMRLLVEHPAELRPDSALAELLAIRMRRVLGHLGAGEG
jgi:hypothetical protein